MKTQTLTQKQALVAGHRIAYIDEGQGQVVLLIHGIPTSSLLWREIIPVLAQSHRVVAPDMLNYGQSDKPAHADVSIAAQSRLMVGLLDTLGIARADVVGHDIGGGVAQLIAVNHSQRVNKLVLASSVCFDSWPIPEFLPLQDPATEAAMTLEAFQTMMRGFLPQGVFRPEALGSEALERLLQPWQGEAGKRALFRNFRRLNSEYTAAIAEQLPQIEAPTLILWGRQDPFQKPIYAERLQRAIPGARLQWFDEAAHWLMEERPEQVAAALKSFLNADRPAQVRAASAST